MDTKVALDKNEAAVEIIARGLVLTHVPLKL